MAFFDLIKLTNEEIKSSINAFENNHKYWDPFSTINLQKINEDSAKLNAKYNKLRANPNIIKRQRDISFVIGLVIFLPFLIFGFGNLVAMIFGIFFCFLPYLMVKGYYSNFSIDLIKFEMAKKNGWLYSPNQDRARWANLRHKAPEIFNKGNKNQYLEDQFWGSIEQDGKTYDFYTGLFSYDVETRDSEGRTRTTTYKRHFFTIKVDKPIGSRFFLYPETVFSKIGNLFTKKEINTESIEFNKTFAFKYDGKKGEKALEIVKTLSPSLQLKLLELNKHKRDMRILFAKDCVFFDFQGKFFQSLDTNLMKNIEISQKDRDMIRKEIDGLTSISRQIAVCLN